MSMQQQREDAFARRVVRLLRVRAATKDGKSIDEIAAEALEVIQVLTFILVSFLCLARGCEWFDREIMEPGREIYEEGLRERGSP